MALNAAGIIFYIFIAVVTSATAFFVKREKSSIYTDRPLLAMLVLELFLPAALRINTGNDYQTYIDHFHDANVGNYVVTEWGFNALSKAVYGFLAGEWFPVLFAIFAFFTVLFFVKALYMSEAPFFQSFVLFMLFGLYFRSMNTMRYYMALAFCVTALMYGMKKCYIRALVLILIAALFHKTALLVLVMYPVCMIRWNKFYYIALGALGISGLIFRAQYMDLFIKLYPSYVNEPELVAEGGGISLVNIARIVFTLCLAAAALMWKREKIKKSAAKDNVKKEFMLHDEVSVYLQMNIAALVLCTCFSFIPFSSRISYYLITTQVMLIPMLLKEKSINLKAVKTAVYAAAMLYFAVFLYRAFGDTTKLLPYHTLLSCDLSEFIKYTNLL